MENEIKKENQMINETTEVQSVETTDKADEQVVEKQTETSTPVEKLEDKIATGTELPEEIKKALENADVKSDAEVKKVTTPKLFITGDEEINVEVDVIFNNVDGDILSVVVAELELDVEKIKAIFGYERYKFVFTRPTYDKLNRYRQKSSEFNQEARVTVINQLKLRDFFLVYHLKDWNIKDENGNKIELEFEPNGTLTDETIDIVYGLHPSILDVVITSFERKLLLVE